MKSFLLLASFALTGCITNPPCPECPECPECNECPECPECPEENPCNCKSKTWKKNETKPIQFINVAWLR